MAEDVKEVDNKGVPLENRFKEYERKIEEKFEARLEQQRKEINELKNQRQFERTAPSNFIEKNDPQKKLEKFIEDPDAYIDQRDYQRDFQRQVPQAESWLKTQKGYTPEARARVDALIYEHKLNTPNHMPMERAQIAWKLVESEMRAKEYESQSDELKREAAIKSSGGEGKGKNAPKDSVDKHQELIKRLAKAEREGDMDTSIKVMDALQDYPAENSVTR